MEQIAFERLRNGRFPGAGKSGQPDDCSPMAGSQRPFPGCNLFLGPENIFALCDASIRINAAEDRAATADLSVVYDHKAAQTGNAIMIVDDEWRASLNCKPANLISLELLTSACHAGSSRSDRTRVALSLECR